MFVHNGLKLKREKPWKKLIYILNEDEHSEFVYIQPWLILIDGRESTIFRATVLYIVCVVMKNYDMLKSSTIGK